MRKLGAKSKNENALDDDATQGMREFFWENVCKEATPFERRAKKQDHFRDRHPAVAAPQHWLKK